nr:D-alanyl-D-alanine carboxypeptidase family protein [Polycladospora coralii]
MFHILPGIPTTYALSSPEVEAESFILLDYETNVVLAERNSHIARPPASMTKMMSEFIVLDQIKSGKLSWEEQVTVSARVEGIDQAQIYLQTGEQETVRELFVAMAVQSANDAAVALAEHIAGSEEHFVKMMNEKAKALGMDDTTYCNATGLDPHLYRDPPECTSKHVMSARDAATLAIQLIKAHPQVVKTTSLSTYTFRPGTLREQKVTNWNEMLTGLKYAYAGVDGVKTGHTNSAGYCFTGSAKRADRHYITVVMGTHSKSKRFTETKKLFDFGFENFKPKEWITKNKSIENGKVLPLPNGVEREVVIVPKDSLRLPTINAEQDKYEVKVMLEPGLKAPVKSDQVVGQATVYYEGKEIEGVIPVDIVTTTGVEEASWLRLFFRKGGDEIRSWF